MSYKSINQYETTDCASACIASISWYYGKKVSLTKLQQYTNMNKNGSSVFDIIVACEKIGLKAKAAKKADMFNGDIISVPCIAHVFLEDGEGHYLVIYKVKKEKIIVSDPAIGLISIDKKDFFNSTFSEKSPYIWNEILVFVEPEKNFREIVINDKNKFILGELLFSEKKLTLQILILSFASMFFNICNAFYYKILLDNIIPKMWVNSLVLITLFFMILNTINIILNKYRVKKALEVSKKINLKLSLEYYNKVLSLPIHLVNGRKKGEFISRLQDINKIQEILVTSILILPVDILLIVIVGVILGIKSITILLLVLLMCVGYVLVVLCFRKNYLINNSKQMISQANMMSYLVDSLEGIETIKIYCQENRFYKNGKRKFLKCQESIIKLADIENNQTVLKTFINNLGRFIVMFIGAFEVIYGNITVGDFVTYNILIGYLLNPINDIINIQPQFHAAQIAMERLEVIIHSISEDNKGKKLACLNEIHFENVGFEYVEGCRILNKINLKILKGEKIAVIGGNGSGKTTIAKLLVKFYLSSSGKISFNNENIINIETNSIRKNIVYVPQEDFILSASIKDNLKFGNEAITDEEMICVAKKTGVHEFVECLPRQYESILEEKGSDLSKGQKQKIALARAILRAPQLLILDEAINSIDFHGKDEIMRYLKEDKNLTLIVITHVAENLANFDCIYVMDKGEIIARGKYDELVKDLQSTN